MHLSTVQNILMNTGRGRKAAKYVNISALTLTGLLKVFATRLAGGLVTITSELGSMIYLLPFSIGKKIVVQYNLQALHYFTLCTTIKPNIREK